MHTSARAVPSLSSALIPSSATTLGCSRPSVDANLSGQCQSVAVDQLLLSQPVYVPVLVARERCRYSAIAEPMSSDQVTVQQSHDRGSRVRDRAATYQFPPACACDSYLQYAAPHSEWLLVRVVMPPTRVTVCPMSTFHSRFLLLSFWSPCAHLPNFFDSLYSTWEGVV